MEEGGNDTVQPYAIRNPGSRVLIHFSCFQFAMTVLGSERPAEPTDADGTAVMSGYTSLPSRGPMGWEKNFDVNISCGKDEEKPCCTVAFAKLLLW